MMAAASGQPPVCPWCGKVVTVDDVSCQHENGTYHIQCAAEEDDEIWLEGNMGDSS